MVEYPDQGAGQLFLTMLTVFARYAGLVVWPAKLSIDYSPQIRSGVDAAVALSALLLLAAAAGLIYLWRRDRRLFFWAALVPVGLLPVSQIIPISTLMNDRYLYFPLLGAAVLIAALLLGALDRIKSKRAGLALLVLLVLLPLPVLSWQRSQVWNDSITLWSDALEKYPTFVTYAGLGNALYRADRIEEAVAMFQKSLELEPSCEEALRSLGAIYLNRRDYPRALHYINRFVTAYPDNAFGQKMLAIVTSEVADGGPTPAP